MSGGILHPNRLESRQNRFFSEGEGAAGALVSDKVQKDCLTPAELSSWLDEQREAMADRWLLEVRSRSEGIDGELLTLIEDFLHLLTSLLAPGLGAFREQVEAILQQSAELYGNLGAHRGLAAGEAVEEMQLLRRVLLRFLYTLLPGGGSTGASLRDLLQLNRLVDLGVTYASVGHTDTLFFNLFHGTGVSGTPTPELLAEVREQVSGAWDELSLLTIREDQEAPGRLPQ